MMGRLSRCKRDGVLHAEFALVLNLSVRFIGGVLGLQLLAFWNE